MNQELREVHWEEEFVPTLFWTARLTISLRVKFFLTGVIYPIICFVVLGLKPGPIGANSLWQSGEFQVYAELLLDTPSFYFLLPGIVACMVCLGIWCWNPDTYRFLPLQIGVGLGALSATVLTGVLFSFTAIVGPIMALPVMGVQAVLVWIAGNYFGPKYRFTIKQLLVTTTVCAVFVALALNFDLPLSLLAVVVFYIVAGSSTMASLTYLRVTRILLYQHQLRRLQSSARDKLLCWFGWLILMAATWRQAIVSVIEEYNKLPVQPPDDCYVCCAAANGYPWIVGAVVEADGRKRNLQMARCKFLEIVCKRIVPWAHKNRFEASTIAGGRLWHRSAARLQFSRVFLFCCSNRSSGWPLPCKCCCRFLRKRFDRFTAFDWWLDSPSSSSLSSLCLVRVSGESQYNATHSIRHFFMPC